MKPDWKDAPEWANYLAMDESGDWYWYETEPKMVYPQWIRGDDTKYKLASTGIDWRDSLEQRPVVVTADSVRYDHERALSRTSRGDAL